MKVESTFLDPHWLIDEAEDNQTEFVIVLVSKNLHDHDVTKIHQLLNENNVVIDSSNALSKDKATEIFITTSAGLAWELFQKFLIMEVSKEIDIAVLPVSSRNKKLLVCDMDSTIIQSETLDDIAVSVGIGEQIKKITARAMCGELDFRQALDERISLLAGTAEDVFDELANTVQFNSGAEKLVGLARQQGLRTVLVSGGFEPIVKVVANRLGFDRYVCNCLEISNGRLTSKLVDPVVDGDTKLNILQEECQQLSIHPSEACAIGDGANDIQMLQAAGLGVGFQG
ncbi:MAG: phosphoserine phosphatase SerB, partial [Gammaproteobacteria bacterium]|nr:phosphoserine phosphatase SerB [Gammaproteobacteria bacterium]